MTAHESLDVAEKLFAAIQAGDLAAVGALYADEVEVWHNTDGVAQTRADNLRTLEWITTNLTGVRYGDIRREATTNGFVQQHVLHATGLSNTPVAIPACIIATVVDGRITRIEEYLDSAQVARLVARS